MCVCVEDADVVVVIIVELCHDIGVAFKGESCSTAVTCPGSGSE